MVLEDGKTTWIELKDYAELLAGYTISMSVLKQLFSRYEDEKMGMSTMASFDTSSRCTEIGMGQTV